MVCEEVCESERFIAPIGPRAGHAGAQLGPLGTMQREHLAGGGRERGLMGKDVFAGQHGIQKQNEL